MPDYNQENYRSHLKLLNISLDQDKLELTENVILKAFRKIMLKTHPDKNSSSAQLHVANDQLYATKVGEAKMELIQYLPIFLADTKPHNHEAITKEKYFSLLKDFGIEVDKFKKEDLTVEMITQNYNGTVSAICNQYYQNSIDDKAPYKVEMFQKHIERATQIKNNLISNLDMFLTSNIAQSAPLRQHASTQSNARQPRDLSQADFIKLLENFGIKPENIKKNSATAAHLINSQYAYLVHICRENNKTRNMKPDEGVQRLTSIRNDLLNNLNSFLQMSHSTQNKNTQGNQQTRQPRDLTEEQFKALLEVFSIKSKDLDNGRKNIAQLIDSQCAYLVDQCRKNNKRLNVDSETDVQSFTDIRDDLLNNINSFVPLNNSNSQPFSAQDKQPNHKKTASNDNAPKQTTANKNAPDFAENNRPDNKKNFNSDSVFKQTAANKTQSQLFLVVINLNANSKNFDPLALTGHLNSAQEVKAFYSITEAENFISSVRIVNNDKGKEAKLNSLCNFNCMAKGYIYSIDNKALAGNMSSDNLKKHITYVHQQEVRKMSSSDKISLENFIKPSGIVNDRVNKILDSAIFKQSQAPSAITFNSKSKQECKKEQNQKDFLVAVGVIPAAVIRVFTQMKDSLEKLKNASRSQDDDLPRPKMK